MKLSEFVLKKIIGTSPRDLVYIAEVTVTTRRFFRKPLVERREIRREFAGYWHFVDTGEYTPGFQAETLARAYEAQQDAKVRV